MCIYKIYEINNKIKYYKSSKDYKFKSKKLVNFIGGYNL